jgi:hypothetical protein
VADPSEMTAPPSRRRGWSASDASGAIYGTIAATAVIAATARHQPPGRVLALTVATLAIFWLAHVYAQALSHHLRGTTGPRWSIVAAAMAEERPMLEAPAPSLLLLLLGAVGLLGEQLAVNLALWVGVAQLTGWGVTYARRQGWDWPPALAAGVINGSFGVVIIALEVFLH